ncbi:MAG: response regulator [Candidatus Methylomirabilia bacterium]
MIRSRKVLVVDDDSVVGHSINRVLTGQGYQVKETLSGLEALEALGHQRYDMVFTDIRMPGMDGLDMAARLKKNYPELPVVIITGYGTEASERQAHDLGVSGFLRKPLSPETIIENAERVLHERAETLVAIRQSALGLMAPTAVAPPALTTPRQSVAKNLGLFLAAPFIGLAYIVAFPFIGLWAMVKAVASHR